MNYQTEDRMLELYRAKFSTNGNCGYILKPKCMCKGMCICRLHKIKGNCPFVRGLVTFLGFSQLPLIPCWRILYQDTERLSWC